MRRLILSSAFSISLFAAASSAIACEKSSSQSALYSEHSLYLVTVLPSTDPIKVASPFSLNLKVCRKDGKDFSGSIKADAQMPMHGHGMNYQPTLKQIDANSFIADGFVLHMPGKWQFDIRLKEASQTANMKIDYQLK